MTSSTDDLTLGTSSRSEAASDPRPGLVVSALAGALAGGVALAAGELAGAFTAPGPGPVVAVANRVIDLAPVWFVNFGKAVFGLADKPALVIGTLILSFLFATALGVASRANRLPGVLGIAAFGLLGWLAIGTDAQGTWLSATVVALVAVLAGVVTLLVLLARATPPARTVGGTDDPTNPAITRRNFLGAAGVVTAGAALGATGANVLRSRSAATQAREAVEIVPGATATELETQVSAAARTGVGATPGISPLVVPNDDFYLIDTAVLTPQVDPANWDLRIKGLVDNEITITYDELLDRAEVTAPVTLSCVSNEVGGNLVGNALWQWGAPGRPAGRGRRPARGDPDRQSLRRRLVVRVPDRGRLRRQDGTGRRRHERRAAPPPPWLPGPARRVGALRLRLGHQVAVGDRADHPRGLRRVLDPPRLVEAGTGQDPVTDRHPERRSGAAGRAADAHRRCGLGPGHRRGDGRGPDR